MSIFSSATGSLTFTGPVDGTREVMGASVPGWARKTLPSFGLDFVELSVSSWIVSLAGVDGRGSSIVTVEKSR